LTKDRKKEVKESEVFRRASRIRKRLLKEEFRESIDKQRLLKWPQMKTRIKTRSRLKKPFMFRGCTLLS